MIRAETAASSLSRPESFLRESMASTRKGSSSWRARSASVKVKRRCGGSGVSSCSCSSSSSAMNFPFRELFCRDNKRKSRTDSSWMLAQTEHAVESQTRIMTGAFVNGNAVDDVTLAEIFERPEEMLRGNAEHGGANANAGVERDDFVVPEFLAEAVDEVNFRAHGPLGARGRGCYGFDDAFGRADFVGGLRDFKAAFGMGDHVDSGMLAPNAFDVLRGEALV